MSRRTPTLPLLAMLALACGSGDSPGMKVWTDVADVETDPHDGEPSADTITDDPGPPPDGAEPPDAPDPGADGFVSPDDGADPGTDPVPDAEVPPIPDSGEDATTDGQPPPDAPALDAADAADAADAVDAPDAPIQCTANQDCDDGLRCTENWCGEDGFCAQIPSWCNDGNQCTKDLCDEEEGCYHSHNVAECDDGNACTMHDHCDWTGWCVGTPIFPKCDDGNPCTDDKCHPIKGCVFTPNQKQCEDGLWCTYSDTCADGTCVPGPQQPCKSWTGCEAGVCDEKMDKCVFTPTPDIPCDDDNLCTSNDRCRPDGDCSGDWLECPDDGNICTLHKCDPTTGNCVMLLNQHLPCDDGNACTVFDECWDTKCRSLFKANCGQVGEQVTPCAVATGCDPVKGCQFAVSEDCDCHDDHDECAWAVTPYCCLFNEEKGGFRCKKVVDRLSECFPPPP